MKRFIFVCSILCLSNVAYAGLFDSVVSQVQQAAQTVQQQATKQQAEQQQAAQLCQIQQQGPIDSNSAILFYNQGLTYSSDKKGADYSNESDREQAINCYNEAIKLNPNDSKFYASRGDAYTNKGDSTSAIADYDKAIEINPNYAMVYNNRGLIYYNQGNLSQAMSDFNKAIVLSPNYAQTYVSRGNIYNNQNNPAQAIVDYSKAIEVDPNCKLAYTNRGTTYSGQGNFTQAMSDYNKAIEIDPNFKLALDNRNLLLKQQPAQQQADQPPAANPESKSPWTDDDIASFVKTFKITNFSQDELKALFNSKVHLISLQVDDQIFLKTLFLFGSNQLTLEQRKRILPIWSLENQPVVDSGKEWYTKVITLEKVSDDTIRLEFEVMERQDPTEAPKPFKKELFYRWDTANGSLSLVQIRAYGTPQGDVKMNNDESTGFAPEQGYVALVQQAILFLGSGKIE